MPRVEIPFPEHALFRTELPIRIDDVNYGGHLGNDAVLALAQEVRLRFLVAHGFASELDVAGVGLVMADAMVQYRAEGRYGMVLEVELAAGEVRSRRTELLYRMRDRATGQEIARVATGLLWFDYAARKVVSMPEAFRRVVEPPPAG
ncbi:acyl-CoA thioesterase [Anaeromyxobacter oryzae]|nr:thioesterase family protein [Anaeromyxobacter oryzae]